MIFQGFRDVRVRGGIGKAVNRKLGINPLTLLSMFVNFQLP